MNQQTLSRKTIGLALALVLLAGCMAPSQGVEQKATDTLLVETIEVTATPSPTPAVESDRTPASDDIHLEADGSGDYATLEEAVLAAPEGGAISLGPGTYVLEEPLNIEKPLHLVGSGMDQAEIVSEAGESVVRFDVPGSFSAEGITFRYSGSEAAGVVIVERGEATFTRCRFTGGIAGEYLVYGTGLSFTPGTTAVVQNCEATGNETDGIQVLTQDASLEGNTCKNNNQGIAFAWDASGVARQNECSGNHIGIGVYNNARPILEENACNDNESAGILYQHDTAGVARGNECTGNYFGIVLFEGAHPTLEENACNNNKGVGIMYGSAGGGVARENECSGNTVGIIVVDIANVELVDNDCVDNTEANIQDGRSSPVAADGGLGLLFTRVLKDGGIHLFVLPYVGAIATQLTQGEGYNYAGLWSPDYEQIAYLALRDQDEMIDLLVMDANGKNARLLATLVEDPGDLRWSPDGRWLAFWGWDWDQEGKADDMEVWLLEVATGKLRKVTDNEIIWDAYPFWHPDSKHLFIVSDRTPDGAGKLSDQIYLIDLDGNVQAHISTYPDPETENTQPALSPTGQTLAWVAWSVFGDSKLELTGRNILLADPDGNNVRLAAEGLSVSDFAWSPDGTHIGFVSTESSFAHGGRIRVLDVESGEHWEVSDPDAPYPAQQFTWRPDSQGLCYTQPREEDAILGTLICVDIDGGNRTVISIEPFDGLPHWGY